VIANGEVLATISRSPWTALVLSSEDQIVEVVPFSCELTPEAFLEFTRTHARGRRFRLVQQADLNEAQLNALVSEVVGSPRQGDAGADRAGQTLADFKSSLHPFAAARAIAEAISRWFAG